jgi:hypothetical protein
MLPGNHFFALDPSMRPSATAKKSFSMASCPIFAWSSFTSGWSGFFSLSKASGARSRSCFFYSAIWLGWTWKRAVVFAGGVPLKKDGKVMGAVGVSGGADEQDQAVAAAGAVAFN